MFLMLFVDQNCFPHVELHETQDTQNVNFWNSQEYKKQSINYSEQKDKCNQMESVHFIFTNRTKQKGENTNKLSHFTRK